MTDIASEKRVEGWRERAEELRVIAEGFKDPKSREDLLKLADQWERMAEREEYRHKIGLV